MHTLPARAPRKRRINSEIAFFKKKSAAELAADFLLLYNKLIVYLDVLKNKRDVTLKGKK